MPEQTTTHEHTEEHFCDFPVFLADNLELGVSALEARDATNAEVNELIKQTIKHLVLHEVGHTLGLNHNMKASQTVSLENLHNTDWTDKHGLVGSVMDYTPINPWHRKEVLKANILPMLQVRTTSGLFNSGTIRIWTVKSERRTLKRSLEPLLTFGNDADDMRSAGKAIDPRVNVGDLSGDTLAWSEQRLRLGCRDNEQLVYG